MRTSIVSIVFGTLLGVIVCTNAFAQATAQISGTVRDQSGAVLPGAEVTATQTATGVARTVLTNETGSYVLPNLALGPYRLEATLPGFRTFVQSGIVLEVNSDPVINPVLDVGQVSEQVEVQANAATVETRTVGVGQVVENTRIMELPLNGRNVIDLIALAGNAAPAPLVTGSNRDSFATASYSVAGGINTGVSYILDGAYNQNPSDNGYAPLPFPDALQEFKVETSATSAEKGMKTAAAVSMVTKSGTNELHGDLFEFVRNGIFNARNEFAAARDTIKRNQFGGTLGGPIAKNRVFFFGGYQGMLFRQDPAQQVALIPTAAMLTGDFTAFTSPACNGNRQIALKDPPGQRVFVNNKVNPALFSRVALNLTAKLPVASADDCGNVIYGQPTRTNDHMTLGKIDYQRSANHSIFGRYFAENKATPSSFDLNHNPLSMNTASRGLGQLFTFGDTYVFGPNVVNALRLTANRLADGKFEPDSMPTAGLGPVALGVKAYDYSPYTANWTVTNAFQITSQGGPTRSAIFGLADDLNVIRGNHQMAFGVNMLMWWANNYSGSQVMATTFNGGTTGTALTDFLLGITSSFSNGPTKIKNKRGDLPALYAADTWKVKPNLTLSYGLRWEPYIPVVDLRGGPIHFDQNAFNNGIKSNQYDTTPPGVLFPGDPGFPLPEGQNKRWMNFAPRVGLAWDLKGDGRTSIRASVGSVYDYPFGQFLNLAGAPPFYPRNTLTNVNIDDPWANYCPNGVCGDPFPLPYGNKLGRNPPFPLLSLVNVIDYNTKNPQSYQWNLNVQRLVGTDWLVSAGYMGVNAIHIWSTKQYNPSVYFYNGTNTCVLPNGTTITGSNGQCSTTTNQEQRRRLTLANPAFGQYYGFMPALDYGSTSSYNALSLSVQRRAAKGVTFNANYTLSHCISDPGGGTELVGSNNTTAYTNPYNRGFDRGNCAGSSTDIRHIFNLSGVAATPQFANGTLRALGSGWRLAPIFRVLSGDYLNVTTTQDRALTATPTQRVNQILANPYGNKTVKNYLNPAAFALPDLGTFANMGANGIRGPGTWQFDAALLRTFQIREGQSVEFRWEAFNVVNGFRSIDPVVNFNNGNFGKEVPTSSTTQNYDPRIMQFGLKYVF